MAEIGEVVLSSLDIAYANYVTWCGALRIKPAPYPEWLRVERLLSGCSMAGLGSYAESRQRLAKLAAQASPA